MNEHLAWNRGRRIELAASALKKNGFDVRVFGSSAETMQYILDEAAERETIGLGGSMSLAEMGLPDRLADLKKTLLIHGRPGLTSDERLEIMRRQQVCDLFLAGTNALTLKGHLVNIDASGNRVCAMAFGPKRVIVVAGVNKIVNDLDSAMIRVKEVACPPNARRLGFDTPCAKTGLCSDCESPQRICRIVTIIERCPRATDMTVCLVNEDLGF